MALARGDNEPAEERVVCCTWRELGVPLDAEREGVRGVFDGLDETFGVPGGDAPTGRSVFEGLVVAGDHSEGF